MPIYPLQSILRSLKFLYDFAGGDPAESPKGKKRDLLKLRAYCPEKKQALQG